MCISLSGGPEANESISFFVLWSSAVLPLMLLKLYFSGFVPKADKTDKANTTKTAFAMIMEVNGNNGRSRGQ